MKKKILAILLCIVAVLMLCVFAVTVGAEEIVTDAVEAAQADTTVADAPAVEESAPTPETTLPAASEATSEEESKYHTIFSRIWEFVEANTEETLSVVGTASLLILNLILKHSGTKTSRETSGALAALKLDVGNTLGGQTAVVEVVNKMIDGYNDLAQRYDAMNEAYELYGKTEDERNRVVGAVLATNTAILEILTTVYVNSKNLPQGVKDIVNLKYANCLKSLEDDKNLIAIVEAVRNNIGGIPEEDTPPESVEEIVAATEGSAAFEEVAESAEV